MKLDIKKWNPWNWFKHENEEDSHNVPVQREPQSHGERNFPATFGNNPLWNIHREFDHLFDRLMSQFGDSYQHFSKAGSAYDGLSGTLLKPNVNIKEDKRNYQITVEIPGVEEDDVKLELANGALTIIGEKKQETEEKDEHYHRIERSYGSFRRVISLPDDVNEEEIEAKFINGVMTITVPRKQIDKPKEEPKLIDIKKTA